MSERIFRRADWLLLIGLCAVLDGWPTLLGRSLSTHEAIHAQNVREMLTDGDFIIPHYGGRAWLERPPLPHWLTAIPVAITGLVHEDRVYRISSCLAGTAIVLLIGWLTARFRGRETGLAAAAILATTREFLNYSIAPECDIFLAMIIAGALTCFAVSEMGEPSCERWRPFAGRPWTMLAFFVLLGATNLAKGLYFGTVLIAVPVTLFILGQRAWSPIRRWLWVWGLVAFGLTAVSWAVAAYLRRPDIVDLWASDYLGRLNQGYMKESRFYYLIHLPWILFPWSLAAIVGMVRAFRAEANSFDRFLVCWAIGDLLILSVPQGKHHHYYLHAVAPWAVLAVDGFRAIWAKLMPTAWPVRKGLIAAVVIAVVGHVASQSYETFTNAYRYDREFAERVSQRIRDGETIVVLNDDHPLDGSWMLFYLPDGTRLLHNPSYLLDESLPSPTVRVVAKGWFETRLAEYGTVVQVDGSERSRGRRVGDECWGLYDVTLTPTLNRVPATIPISATQATGRSPGPFLKP